MAYATLAELRSFVGIDDAADDTTLTLALSVAQRQVDDWCGRTFDTVALSARTMRATNPWTLLLDPGWDISTATGLVVKTDDNDDGVAETTWTIATDFVLGSSGVGYDGATGWPYSSLRAVGSRTWPTATLRPAVEITATWGWASVPVPVKQATLLLAAEAFKSKDAPFGVAAFGEFGPLRVRANPMVAQLLARYRHPVTSAVVA